MTMVIEMPPLPAPINELWHVLLDLEERLTVHWSVIGGQMVLLHALERGHTPPQVSQDGDVIADIRADPASIRAIVAQLEDMGFELAGISTDGIAHRYARDSGPSPVVIDVLAPEGVGERANLVTSPPGRTVEVPGGTQALGRTELVTITHEGRQGRLPRPTLLAALVGKRQLRAFLAQNAIIAIWPCCSASSKTRSRSWTSSHPRTGDAFDWRRDWTTKRTRRGRLYRLRSGLEVRSPTRF